MLFWATLTGAQDVPELVSLRGHSGGINSVAFSPGGKQIVSGGSRAVKIWDIGESEPQYNLLGHSRRINAVAYSPDGRRIGSAAVTIILWDAATGERLQTLESRAKGILSIAFAPRENILASANADSKVRLWNLDNGTVERFLEGHQDSVHAVAFSPDGSLLASASSDHTVKLWDVATGVLRYTLEGHEDRVRGVSFSPKKGLVLASVGSDGRIRLWATENGAPLKTFRVPSDPDPILGAMAESIYFGTVQFSPNGYTLATGEFGNLRSWDATEGQQQYVIDTRAAALAYSPDGEILATAGFDRRIKLWRAENGKQVKFFEGYRKIARSVVISPDGNLIASGAQDGRIRLWDPNNGRLLRVLEGHLDEVIVLRFSPDGTVLASGGRDETARLWDLRTGQALHVLDAHVHEVAALGFFPGSETLLTGNSKGTVKLWDVETGKYLRRLQGLQTLVAFSPLGTTVASACSHNCLSEEELADIRDLRSGEILHTLRGHTDRILAVTYSPNGTLLATAGRDKTVKVWNTGNGRKQWDLSGHTASVKSLAFSPDSKILASGSTDRTIKLWHLGTGELLGSLEKLQPESLSLAFMPSGDRLIAAAYDGGLRHWDLKESFTGELLALSFPVADVDFITYTPERFFVASEGGIRYSALHQDRRYYLSADEAPRFHDPSRVERRLRFKGPEITPETLH